VSSSCGDGPDEVLEPEVPTDGPETVGEQRLLASLGRRARQANLARVVRLLELLDPADGGPLGEDARQEA